MFPTIVITDKTDSLVGKFNLKSSKGSLVAEEFDWLSNDCGDNFSGSLSKKTSNQEKTNITSKVLKMSYSGFAKNLNTLKIQQNESNIEKKSDLQNKELVVELESTLGCDLLKKIVMPNFEISKIHLNLQLHYTEINHHSNLASLCNSLIILNELKGNQNSEYDKNKRYKYRKQQRRAKKL